MIFLSDSQRDIQEKCPALRAGQNRFRAGQNRVRAGQGHNREIGRPGDYALGHFFPAPGHFFPALGQDKGIIGNRPAEGLCPRALFSCPGALFSCPRAGQGHNREIGRPGDYVLGHFFLALGQGHNSQGHFYFRAGQGQH